MDWAIYALSHFWTQSKKISICARLKLIRKSRPLHNDCTGLRQISPVFSEKYSRPQNFQHLRWRNNPWWPKSSASWRRLTKAAHQICLRVAMILLEFSRLFIKSGTWIDVSMTSCRKHSIQRINFKKWRPVELKYQLSLLFSHQLVGALHPHRISLALTSLPPYTNAIYIFCRGDWYEY